MLQQRSQRNATKRRVMVQKNYIKSDEHRSQCFASIRQSRVLDQTKSLNQMANK